MAYGMHGVWDRLWLSWMAQCSPSGRLWPNAGYGPMQVMNVHAHHGTLSVHPPGGSAAGFGRRAMELPGALGARGGARTTRGPPRACAALQNTSGVRRLGVVLRAWIRTAQTAALCKLWPCKCPDAREYRIAIVAFVGYWPSTPVRSRSLSCPWILASSEALNPSRFPCFLSCFARFSLSLSYSFILPFNHFFRVFS